MRNIALFREKRKRRAAARSDSADTMNGFLKRSSRERA